MKKLSLVACLTFLSSSPLYAAVVNSEVGVGYQTSSVDSNYGECNPTRTECYGSVQPRGYVTEAQLLLSSKFFASFDSAHTNEQSNIYKATVGNIWDEVSYGMGVVMPLSSDTEITIAQQRSKVKWSYSYSDASSWWGYQTIGRGSSWVVGVNSKLSDKVTMGGSFSKGFAIGLKAYTQLAISDSLALKLTYTNTNYKMTDWSYDSSTGSAIGTAFGDAPIRFDNRTFRATVQYMF